MNFQIMNIAMCSAPILRNRTLFKLIIILRSQELTKENKEHREPPRPSICKWKVQLAGVRKERVFSFSVFAHVFEFGAGLGTVTPNYQSATGTMMMIKSRKIL